MPKTVQPSRLNTSHSPKHCRNASDLGDLIHFIRFMNIIQLAITVSARVAPHTSDTLPCIKALQKQAQGGGSEPDTFQYLTFIFLIMAVNCKF